MTANLMIRPVSDGYMEQAEDSTGRFRGEPTPVVAERS